MARDTEEPLELTAKRLLKWKIDGEQGAPPTPVFSKRMAQEINFLEERSYIVLKGENPKCARYGVTAKGEEYASS